MSILESLLVRHIMTRSLVSLREHHSLPLASVLMFERGVHHLPILDEEGCLLGLVSQRDLLAAEISHVRALSSEEREEIDLLVPLGKIMTRDVVTLTPDMTARAAVRQMLASRHGCALVLDARAAVCGIVAEDDILTLFLQCLAGQRLTVADIMTRELITAHREMEIGDAARLMETEDIHHLPIASRDGLLEGLVSHRDLQVFQRSTVRHPGNEGPQQTLEEFADRQVWTTAQATDALEAAQTLRDNHFGCLPIVEDRHLVGIVTQSDFLRQLLETDTEQGKRTPVDVPSNYYVSKPLRAISPEQSIDTALQHFAQFGISTLLVMDQADAVGILSQSDVVKALSEPAHLDPETLLERTVADFMTRDLVTVSADQTIGEAASVLTEKQIHHLVVVDSEQPVGILGTSDILLAVRDHRVADWLGDIMTRVVFTIDVHESLSAGMRYMERADISCLVVLDDQWPVGIFGHSEALTAIRRPLETQIEQVMSSRFLCLPSEMPSFRAAGQAAALGVHQIVVLSGGNPVGIASASDFARLLARVASGGFGDAEEVTTDLKRPIEPTR